MIFELEPVKRDKLGRNVADYQPRDFYEKLAEEFLEAHGEAAYLIDFDEETFPDDLVQDMKLKEARELIDLMTVCATRIAALDLPQDTFKQIQLDTINRNRERGYLNSED